MLNNRKGTYISWVQGDLLTKGYIKDYAEWQEFVDYMNEAAMRFFEDICDECGFAHDEPDNTLNTISDKE